MKSTPLIGRLIRLLCSAVAMLMSACATVKTPHTQFAKLDAGQLEYVTTGQGQPVIVFLNGYGLDLHRNWEKVLPEAEKLGTVIAYNRFGDGASDKAPSPQTGLAVISTLRQLLQMKDLKPPYILVGHSIGGLYANLYARKYPQEVAGVVLVDATHPDQVERWRGHTGFVQRVTWSMMQTLSSKNAGIRSFDENAREIREAGPFPDIPLTVITAGIAPPSWITSREATEIHRSNQRELTALSPKGKQVIAEKSGHLIPMDQPELVIQAIGEMVRLIP